MLVGHISGGDLMKTLVGVWSFDLLNLVWDLKKTMSLKKTRRQWKSVRELKNTRKWLCEPAGRG